MALAALALAGCSLWRETAVILEPAPVNFETARVGEAPLYYDGEDNIGDIVVPLGGRVLLRLDTYQGSLDLRDGASAQGTVVRGTLYVPPGSSLRFVEDAFVARDSEASEQHGPIVGLYGRIHYGRTLSGLTAREAQSSGPLPGGFVVAHEGDRNVARFEVHWEGFMSERFTITVPAVEVDGQVTEARTISFSYVERTLYCSAALFTAQSCGVGRTP